MDDQEKEHESLERILNDSSADPIMLSYAFLKTITKDFSEEIGRGGFGEVYMGVLQNGKVAVKKLYRTFDFSDQQFEDELLCLIRVKHKNIVRCLGYCSDTSRQVVHHNGKHVVADVRKRYLCFEYAPNKSLRDYLIDNSHTCEWDICYQFIEGICQGLHYLHNEGRINHLDLKPENILLDAEMIPKITDFGLSKRFSGSQSRVITENIRGSPGYMAPEYWRYGQASFKSDIFSLGVIIKKILRESGDGSSDFENGHQSVHINIPQVKKCIKIAQLCVDEDQHKRPTIDDIIDMLNEKENVIHKVSAAFSHSGNISEPSAEQVNYELIQLPEIDPIEPLKDRAINFVSNAASNDAGPSMVNEQIGPDIAQQFQGAEHNLILYMHQNIDNQVNIADPEQPHMFGYTNVHDYPIYDSLGPSAKIVARAQGLHAETSMNNSDDWFHWSSIVFGDERFQKSSFKAIGIQNKIKGEWAIVGGTGVFIFALGTISIHRIEGNGSSNIKEIRINAFCSRAPRTTPTEAQPFKDMSIMVGLNASSKVPSTSVGNRQMIGPVDPHSQGAEYNTILYMHQTIHNQVNIFDPGQPQMFGYTYAHDYPIYDSLGPSAKIVARAQGLHTETSMNTDDWFHWNSIVFTDDERFQKSSFKAIGNQNKVEGEWVIVGGTGVFTSAQGSIFINRIQGDWFSSITEIRISAFCGTTQTTPINKTKLFKDRWIKFNSNTTSNNVFNTSIGIQHIGPVNPQPLQGAEYNRILYMHQTIDGPNRNQVNIADPKQPMMFGFTNVHDYPIYDSLDPGATIVARAQGLHTETCMNNDDWFHWSSIVFCDERFGESSLKALGNQNKVVGEWAIIGGTGVFTCALGTISIDRKLGDWFSNIKEIRIRAFLPYTTEDSN